MYDDKKIKNEIIVSKHDPKKLSLILVFLGIFFIGFTLRMYYLPYDIPITLDGLVYFWYANDIAITGTLPLDYSPANNGWPIFLSMFFQILNSDNFLDYMTLQRTLTVILSSLTIFPLYFIIRKFFAPKFALIGIALFSFEPRIIQNSVLGVTEPLFILLTTISIWSIISCKRQITIISFPLIAFATLVRSEAIILLIPYSILYIIKYRKLKSTSYELPALILLFFLIIIPMAEYRTNVNGSDTIFSRIPNFDKSNQFVENDISSELNISKISLELKNIISMVGWASIPIFLVLIPYGMYSFVKQRTLDNYSILTILFFMLIPAIYAISFLPDTRYLYITYPILCLISVTSIKKITDSFHNKKYILIAVTIIILISSIIFLEIKKIDLNHEIEALKIAEIISTKTKVINQFSTESGYIPIIGIKKLEEFPILKNEFERNESNMNNCSNVHNCKYILGVKSDDIVEFLRNAEKLGITHLIIDDKEQRRAEFVKKILHNENAYSYLTKIYDSKENGFTYNVKIFEIDFEKFNDEISKK